MTFTRELKLNSKLWVWDFDIGKAVILDIGLEQTL